MKFKMIATRFLLLLCVIPYTNCNVSEEEKVHCLHSNKPLLLKDPFPASALLSDDFLAFQWSFLRGGPNDLKILTVSSPTDKKIKVPRWQVYQNWGLQLNDPKLNDSGQYKASLVTLANSLGIYNYVNVIVAEPPELMTKRLAVTKIVSNNTEEVTLTCGTLASLGTPPVQLIWRISNGTTYDGVYKDGNITLVLSKEQADHPISCEVKKDSSAMNCVPPGDLPRWEDMYNTQRNVASSGPRAYLRLQFNIQIVDQKKGTYVQYGGLPAADWRLRRASHTPIEKAESNMMIILIIAIAGTVVLLLAAIVTSVVVVKKSRQDEEAKKENGQGGGGGGGDQSYPLMINDDSNPYDKPNANASNYYGGKDRPTSPAGHSTGLYMVSGLNLPQGEKEPIVELPPKKKKLSGSALDNIDIAGQDKCNGKPAGRYAKRGETKDPVMSRSDSDSKEPPTPKKRSIFLTESNEALDKIAEAVAGGKGSGADRDRGRVGESSV